MNRAGSGWNWARGEGVCKWGILQRFMPPLPSLIGQPLDRWWQPIFSKSSFQYTPFETRRGSRPLTRKYFTESLAMAGDWVMRPLESDVVIVDEEWCKWDCGQTLIFTLNHGKPCRLDMKVEAAAPVTSDINVYVREWLQGLQLLKVIKSRVTSSLVWIRP